MLNVGAAERVRRWPEKRVAVSVGSALRGEELIVVVVAVFVVEDVGERYGIALTVEERFKV